MLGRLLARWSGVPRLHVLVRQSPDWSGDPARLLDDSRAFCRLIGRPEELIVEAVRLWDATFDVPFFAVRAEMKRIAQDNLRRVRHAVACDRASFDPERVDASALYLFIDDDDWLHPQLPARVRPHRSPTADGYRFGSIKFGDPIELRALDDTCYTNNYAVAGGYLRSEEHLARVEQHWSADAWFRHPEFTAVNVPLHLTATNKHPCSTLVLEECLKQERSGEALMRMLHGYLHALEASLPPQAAWIAPYARRVRQFFRPLLRSPAAMDVAPGSAQAC